MPLPLPCPTPHTLPTSQGRNRGKKKPTKSARRNTGLPRRAHAHAIFAKVIQVVASSAPYLFMLLTDFLSSPLSFHAFPKVFHRLSTAGTSDNTCYPPIPQALIRRFLDSSSALRRGRARAGEGGGGNPEPRSTVVIRARVNPRAIPPSSMTRQTRYPTGPQNRNLRDQGCRNMPRMATPTHTGRNTCFQPRPRGALDAIGHVSHIDPAVGHFDPSECHLDPLTLHNPDYAYCPYGRRFARAGNTPCGGGAWTLLSTACHRLLGSPKLELRFFRGVYQVNLLCGLDAHGLQQSGGR